MQVVKANKRKGTDSLQASAEETAKYEVKSAAPVREHQSKTEQELTKHGQYSYMHDLRGRIDSTMADTTISDF
ncbi:hypothetical protein ABMB44_14925 [Levilactobacillus brevis]